MIRPSRLALALATAGLIAWTWSREPVFLFSDVLLLLLAVSIGCALVGTWLVLRRMAMMADAIGHAILLGIVGMFFFVQDPASPLFIVGAALAGILTVFLTESLLRTRLVREDASIGLVFSFLFALALVITALFFRDAHVDQHVVLAGGVEITVLRQVIVEHATLPHWLSSILGGPLQALLPVDAVRVTRDGVMSIENLRLGPRALWTMAGIVLVNLAFLGAFWKELKLATFDPGLAASLGFSAALINYALMTLVAVTAVGSFEAVGSILVIALFVTPAATAFLLTEDLGDMVVLAVIIAALDTWLGFTLGRALNANFGGSVAVAACGVFLLALAGAPNDGLVSRILRRRRQGHSFEIDLLLVHLATHVGTASEERETAVSNLPDHLHWAPERTERVLRAAERAGFVRRAADRLVDDRAADLAGDRSGDRSGDRLELTPLGQERATLALTYDPSESPRLP